MIDYSSDERVIYLIDGVSVSRLSWERNKFWEPESNFQIVYVPSQKGQPT